MKLKDILSISGKGGLYKFISQARNGIIVESFDDGKRTAISASAKVSALEDIAIFTETEEVPLADIFKKIYEKENGKETINHKSSPEELKAFIESVLPDYDKERVYVSDIKKLVMWYNILISHNLFKPDEEEEEKNADEKKSAEKAVAKEKKPAAGKNPKSQAPRKSKEASCRVPHVGMFNSLRSPRESQAICG